MTAAARLGLRLALGAEGRERVRAATVVLAATVGCWVLLTTLAVARSEWQQQSGLYSAAELRNLVLAVVTVVALPVAVLVASVARLSAVVRDRRLAGLRLLGLTPARTRLVAAVESGAGAAVGSLLGLALFWMGRPVVSQLQVAGRDWSGTSFTPWPLAAVAAVVGLPALSVLVALLPTQGLRRDMLASARLDAARRPSPWRLLPLGAGLAVMAASSTSQPSISDARLAAFGTGAVLCGLGSILVIPVLTRLVGDLLVRVPGRPALRIAGRRLQAQPAGVSRVVAGLLVGLFLVTGGRMVLGAFENTPQYIGAELAIEGGHGQYGVYLPPGVDPADVAEPVAAVDGVRGVFVERIVQTRCLSATACVTAFVGTCADLALALPGVSGCDDDSSAWIGDGSRRLGDSTDTLVWRGRGDSLTLPRPARSLPLTGAVDPDVEANLHVFLPASTPRVLELTSARSNVVAVAVPRPGIARAIEAAVADLAPRAQADARFSRADYDFVAGLRALVWAVAAVVLAVGLLGFVIAAADRTVARRAEMVSLQLVGTPRGVIRAAQWCEAALPLAVGLPLAVLLGWSVGSGYLAFGGALEAQPWQSVLGLAGVSIAAGLCAAGTTVLACAPRIRADLIRRT